MSTNNNSLATYGLLVVLAGVGGWAIHEAMADELPQLEPMAAPVGAPLGAPFGQVTATDPYAMTLLSPGLLPGQVDAQGGDRVRAGHGATQTAIGSWAAPSPGMVWPSGGQTPVSYTSPGFTPWGTSAGAGENARSLPAAVVSPSTAGWAYGPNGPQILATSGAIVYMGDNGHLAANTGATATSGIVAIGVDGSSLGSGGSLDQSVTTALPAPTATYTLVNPHANGSFAGLVAQQGAGSQATSISGFEDHSVSVLGNGQVVTYDDSNVVIDRDGLINANTGDTDSSGLNAVDVTGSVVRSGNSGDGEGGDDAADEAEDEPALPVGGGSGAMPRSAGVEHATSSSSDDEDGSGNDEAREDGVPRAGSLPGSTYGTVTDEGASIASGGNSFVIGADGYDDVSIRSTGDNNLVSYDDSNVVVGGRGQANLQIGDSDTGGAVVMGIHGSDVRAGCEGDLCYSD